jgi:nitroreductase
MELIEGINTRSSIRDFRPDPVPRETLERILRAASRSPSRSNTQPWEVAVVSGEKKERLSSILYEMANSGSKPNPDLPSPTNWPQTLDRRAKEHYAKRFELPGIGAEDEKRRKELHLRNFQFYKAPCVMFLFTDSMSGAASIFDMGLFAQSIILAAHSFNLGSCIQASAARYPDAVRDFLGIPKTKSLLVAISIGYPNSDAQIASYRSGRIGLDEFAKWYDKA